MTLYQVAIFFLSLSVAGILSLIPLTIMAYTISGMYENEALGKLAISLWSISGIALILGIVLLIGA